MSALSSASQEEIAEMKEVFACFDKDSSGTVTTQELGAVLRSMNKNYSEDDLKKIVSKFDFNGVIICSLRKLNTIKT